MFKGEKKEEEQLFIPIAFKMTNIKIVNLMLSVIIPKLKNLAYTVTVSSKMEPNSHT